MFTCLYAPPRSLACRITDGVPRARDARRVTDQLVYLAREYSPRIEIHGESLVVLDTTGLTSMFGDVRELGAALRRSAADQGLYLRIAVASTRIAALLVVQERSGFTVIEPGQEAATLAALPLDVLKALAQGTVTRARCGTRETGAALAIPAFALLSTVRRWGIRTLGDLAHLPSAALFERLGTGGLTLQQFARGEDNSPIVPVLVEERFESSLALEWPVEGLEPLSFVLSRMFEQLCARLERASVRVAVLHVYLKLVTQEIHTCTLQLSIPLRDPRVLRTLVLLDLESHTPSAGIDQITVVVDPVPARTQQFSLFERAGSSPEKVSTLVARLTALVGEDRCGSPALVDLHDTAGFEMRRFAPAGQKSEVLRLDTGASRLGQVGLGLDNVRKTPVDGDWRQAASVPSQKFADKFSRRRNHAAPGHYKVRRGGIPAAFDSIEPEAQRRSCRVPRPESICELLTRDTRPSEWAPMRPMLRRFRVPVAARVGLRKGRPVRVIAPRISGGEVVHLAGPWRTSGQWWTDAHTVRGESSALHRDPLQAMPRPARAKHEEGAYRQYSTEEQRRQLGCSTSRMQVGSHHGLPAPAATPEPDGALPWDRDEWDVSLIDGGVYRIFHDRRVDRWFLEGMVD